MGSGMEPWLFGVILCWVCVVDCLDRGGAVAAIVPGLVSLIVGVICNGVRRGAVVVWGDFVMGLCR